MDNYLTYILSFVIFSIVLGIFALVLYLIKFNRACSGTGLDCDTCENDKSSCKNEDVNQSV